jgi:exonuclease III
MRKRIHNNINKSPSNLFVLIDTRTSPETEIEHQKCTKHKMYFNHLRSNARGVAVLVKDSCPITDIESTVIFPGNITKFNFTHKGEKFSTGTLYAPNNKDIHFFETLFKDKLDTDADHTMYLGDWNISLSQQMDTHGYLNENNTENRDYVKAKIIELELKDLWRERNPHELKYTFMKNQAKNFTKARLDFLLTDHKTSGYIESLRIDGPTNLSDHRSFSFTIAKLK